MAEIISRSTAISQGKKKYFTARACKNGHIAERYVQSATCEECIRESRSIVVAAPLGEILPPSKDNGLQIREQQLGIYQERSSLIKEAIEIQKRKLAIREQTIKLQIQGREERKKCQHRAAVKKSRLIEVYCPIEPVDYETVLAMIWAFAIAQDPALRAEDLVKSKLKEKTFVMLCFPEDKAQILKITNEMFDIRHGVAKTPDMILIEEFMNSLDKRLTMDQKREALGLALSIERNGQLIKPQLQLTGTASPTVTPLPQNVAKILALEDEIAPEGDPR